MSKAQLALALSGLPQVEDSRVLVGSNTADDAGVFQISPDLALVHTVDLLAPVVDDPYTFGRIAAVNSLSDVYAMGGEPLTAMNVIGFPRNLDAEVMKEILHGGQDAVIEAGAVTVGGHTFCNDDLMYGLSVCGEISPAKIVTNAGAKPGDLLILTKPLGTGTLIQAMVTRGVIPAALYNELVSSMIDSNRISSELMVKRHANACTDITGFGFIGHCWEMCEASNVGVRILTGRLPALSNVFDLIRDEVTDTGIQMNRNSFEEKVDFEDSIPDEYIRLLYSSETSGGLLISIPSEGAEGLISDMQDSGIKYAAIVGEVTDAVSGRISVCR